MSARVRNNLRKDLLDATEHIFGQSVDVTLSLLAYLTAMCVIPSQKGSASFQASIAADDFLAKVNYKSIKNALGTAWKKQYITRNRHAIPAITKAGKQRLQQVMPAYDEVRLWDGKLHVVTYDIPEKKHITRDVLREQLRRLGCAKMQASVWLTPYNPIDTLREFISEKSIEGTVIISDLGSGAAIGEETTEALIIRLYELEKLNDRYTEWLNSFEKRQKDFSAVIQYLSILKDDPQLPFPLLPTWWKGDYAYQQIQPILSKML